MKIVLEITDKEKKALKEAGRDIKNSFKKIKNSFQVRVVKEKKK
ncbi:MAG: hypothetical protein ABSG05_02905 [Candidatus Pacearchaeota archaeon]|jgi:hypothetical protein